MTAKRARSNPSYRNPPQEHRFQKGRSGNPQGRPRKGDTRALPTQSSGELFRRISREPIQIAINGEARKVSGEEAFLRSLQARAIKGEARAMREYVNLLTRFSGNSDLPTPTHEDFLAGLEPEPPPDAEDNAN